jgi:hypothetical protein
MADSENSRTLPKITRRDVLISAATVLELSAATTAPGEQHFGTMTTAQDPAVLLWRQWRIANAKSCELCYRQQRLENTLLDLRRSQLGMDKKIVAATFEYRSAKRDEMEAMDAEEALAKTLLATPASSMIGAIAKLHSVIETEDPGVGLEETPWPELRMILADLLRIDA